jgi:cephalosporin-C deacetylase-like acetyl esterase
VSPNRDILEEPTPIVPVAATDHELLRDLVIACRAMAKDLASVKAAIPALVTRSECMAHHPGVERWLKLVLLVVAVIAAGWGAWQLMHAIERNEALAQELRSMPRAHAAASVHVPVPVIIALPDAAVPPPAKRRRP